MGRPGAQARREPGVGQHRVRRDRAEHAVIGGMDVAGLAGQVELDDAGPGRRAQREREGEEDGAAMKPPGIAARKASAQTARQIRIRQGRLPCLDIGRRCICMTGF